MLSLGLAALLSVALGHPVAPNCALNPALLFSGQVLPTPSVPLSGTATGPITGHETLLQLPLQQTSAIAQAATELMAAWNAAVERVNKIQATVVVELAPASPAPVSTENKLIEALQRAVAEFIAAWNAAAQRASVVEAGVINGTPSHAKFAPDVQHAMVKFMSAWHDAAQRAASVKSAFSSAPDYSSRDPPQVSPNDEPKRATTDFMKAWEAAAAQVPKIKNTMYEVSGIQERPDTSAYYYAPQSVKFTPEVEWASAEFMAAFDTAAALAAAAPTHDASSLPVVMYSAQVPSVVYTAPKTYGEIEATVYTNELDVNHHDLHASDNTASFVPTNSAQPPASLTPDVPTTPTSGTQASGALSASGYTHEVELARRQFQKAFNEAAALAAAAPDDTDFRVTVGSSLPTDIPTSSTGGGSSGVLIASDYTNDYNGLHWQSIQPGELSANNKVDQAGNDFQKVLEDTFSPDVHVNSVSLAQAVPLAIPGAYNEADQSRSDFQKVYEDTFSPDVHVNSVSLTYDAPSGIPGVYNEAHQPRNDFQGTFENTLSPDVHVNSVSLTHDVLSGIPAAQPPYIYDSADTSARITASGFTQEVDEARRKFLAIYEKVASRTSDPNQTPKQHSAPQISTPIESSPAEHKYTVSLTSSTVTPSGFTPEVEQARKEFMKAYDAAVALAAKTPDYSAVIHTSTAQALQVAGPQPTPEVAKATAEFMAAWNAAAARVATIEAKLVKSSPSAQATITVPEQKQTAQEIKTATEEFLSAWNTAVQRTPIVQQALKFEVPTSEQPTKEIQRATSELMAAWQAAASRAPKIEQAVLRATSYSTGTPEVEAIADVQKTIAEFMAAWNAAATRVPDIETTMYSVAQPAAASNGETNELLNLFKSAEERAIQPNGSVSTAPIRVDADFANNVGSAIAYAGTTASSPETVATLTSFPLSNRLFAPIQGLPVFYNCNCK